MEKEDELFEGESNNEDDLFDISLDDLTSDDIDQGPQEDETDDEVIELMDLIEKGGETSESGDRNLDQLIEDHEQPLESSASEVIEEEIKALDTQESFEETEIELDARDAALESGHTPEEAQEPEMLLGEDPIERDFEILEETDREFDLTIDDSLVMEESLEDLVEEVNLEEEGSSDKEAEFERAEFGEEIIKEQSSERDFDRSLEGDSEGGMEKTDEEPEISGKVLEPSEEADLEARAKMLKHEAFPEGAEENIAPLQYALSDEDRSLEDVPIEQLAGISEEKMEAIITRVVENVLDRVVRETLTNVAEKVITEAIDTLRQSIESNSNQGSG